MDRKKDFKKGISSDDKRRQRQEEQLSLRKSKRDEKMEVKRRQVVSEHIAEQIDSDGDAPLLIPLSREEERKERHIERTGEFKRGITSDDAFAKRAKEQIARIKNKRASRLSEKRNMGVGMGVGEDPSPLVLKDAREWKKLLYLSSDNPENIKRVFKAIQHFRSLTSSSSEDVSKIIEAIIQLGIGPRIIELSNASNFPKIQYEATWLLTNISSGNSDQTRYVANLPHAIEVLVKLLNTSSDEKLRENVVWTLSNMAGDSLEYRNNVLSINNVVPLFLKNLNESTSESNTKTTVWALSNLFRGKPHPNIPRDYVLDTIRTLAKIFKGLDEHSENNKELLSDLCWTFSFISDVSELQGNIHLPLYGNALIQSGVIKKMIELLYSQSMKIKRPSLRTIGNLAAGTSEQTSYLIKEGFLVKCASLMNHADRQIRKEAVWILSNIAAGTSEQKDIFIRSGLLERVISLLGSDSQDVKNECLWTLTHISDKQESLKTLVDYGVLPALCDSLSVADPDFLLRGLTLLKAILKYGKENGELYSSFAEDADCIDKLEVLQEHANHEIYEMAVDIIEKYFNDDEEQGIYSPVVSDKEYEKVYSPSMPKWGDDTEEEIQKGKYNF